MAMDWSKYEVNEDGTTKENGIAVVGQETPQSLAGLPRHRAVEANISGRQDLMSRGLENIGRTISPEQMSAGQRVMSPLVGAVQTLGGAYQRGEAVIANPVLELQRMGAAPDEEMAKFKWQDYISKPAQELVKGVKGERLGETGDPYRKMIKNPVLSEIAGIASGLFTMNAFTAAKPAQTISKPFKSKKISQFDDLADKNLQLMGNSLKQIGRNVKDKWKAAVEPFAKDDTVYRSTDIASTIGNKFADVFEGSLSRLNKITGGTDTGLITPSGQKIVRRLTIGEMTDLLGDMYTDINKHILSTVEATGRKPNTAKLYQTVSQVKNMLRKSFPENIQKQIMSMSDTYGDVVPKIDTLMYDLGWSERLRSFDTAKAAKLFTNAKQATKLNYIKKFYDLDKNLTKYYLNLEKWGKKISPSKVAGALGVGVGAAMGSALGQKIAGKASNIIMPGDDAKPQMRGVN